MSYVNVFLLCVLAAHTGAFGQNTTPQHFVEKGTARLVRTQGAAWTQGEGYLECSGTGNYLFASPLIGTGDFRIQAKLRLDKLDHTAATVVLGGKSSFGLDGKDGKCFASGPLFGGKLIYFDDSAGIIEGGKPFSFEVIRKGNTVRILIDGTLVYTTNNDASIGHIGLRPWRSTMRVYDFWAEGTLIDLPPPAQPRGFTIPVIDLAHEPERRVIVESTPGQYLGHPTTVLLSDNKSILVTYPLGHGRPAAVLKKSSDGGLTWSERLPVPENWATATNCPCIHRLIGPDGVERLFVFEGRSEMRQSVSLDNGVTWTPFETNGLHCVVAPITIVPIAGNRLLMHYHRGEGDQDRSPLTIWQSISADGGLSWGDERMVASLLGADLCEPALIRSPDGKQLASIMRENARYYNSMLITSDDEGATWSKPVELPGALTGDRHMPRYAHDGRLVMTFRDTGYESPTRGNFVGWVGTYDDMVHLREGQYRLLLIDSPTKMDLGYPGLERLPDGTFVTTTYAVLNKGEKNSVASVRFTLSEIDQKAAALEQ